jgi:hypothetical protein
MLFSEVNFASWREENMNIGEILEKAWRIIWKHKVLWIFGILAGCGSNSGGVNFNNMLQSRSSGSTINNQSLPNVFNNQIPPQIENFLLQLQHGQINWAAISGVVLAVACILAILWLIALVIGTFGRIGLVRGAWLSDAGMGPINFSSLWGQSALFFWRVLLFNILLMVIQLVLIAMVIGMAFVTLGFGLCLALPLMVVVEWFLTVWTQEAIVAIVGDNLSVGEAINRSWNMIFQNLGTFALTALILFIGSGIISFVIGLPAILIAVPIVVGTISSSKSVMTTSLIVAGILLLIYLPIAVILSGILNAYLGTAWTLVYRRMTGLGPVAEPAEPAAPTPVEVFTPPSL